MAVIVEHSFRLEELTFRQWLSLQDFSSDKWDECEQQFLLWLRNGDDWDGNTYSDVRDTLTSDLMSRGSISFTHVHDCHVGLARCWEKYEEKIDQVRIANVLLARAAIEISDLALQQQAKRATERKFREVEAEAEY